MVERRLTLARSLIAALSSVVTAACTGGPEKATVPAAVPTTVKVSLSATTIQVGQTATASAALFDQNGAAMSVGTVLWSTGDANVATVAGSTGVTTGRGVGQATITATIASRSGTADITVTPFSRDALSSKANHTCWLTDAGAAYCWGENLSGQVGNGTTFTPRPTPVAVLGGIVFSAISAGWYHTCGLANGGAAYCWGEGWLGRLGNGSSTGTATTRPVPTGGGMTFSALATGGNHACGLTSGGAAYCWGENDGQLGDGTMLARLLPTPVSGGLAFTALSSGMWHTCGLTTTNATYCWGRNESGQLGGGTAEYIRTTPVAVQGGPVFAALSAGGRHTCGLTISGTAYCWGSNENGQLGDGTRDSHATPAPVAAAFSFIALSTGLHHSCGLAASGAAFCWGNNVEGQLGDGTTTMRLSPVAVQFGPDFVALAVGGYHTCGLTATRGVYCWGANYAGQVGDGTTIDRWTPVRIAVP